jgi:hypothetical protein
VEERFRNRQIGYDVFDGREAHYYLGRWNFLRLNLDSARVHFEKCDELSRSIDRGGPSGFMVMANLTLGMVFDAKGDRKNAVAQYRKVLRMKEYGTSHVDARRYLETPYRRNW